MKQRKASARREEQAAQNQGMRLRTRLLGAAMALLCFGVLAGRLYWLQVVQHDLYAQRAENQQLRSTRIPAPRGEILDRSGQTLATSATCWTVRAAPRELEAEDVDAASRTLAEILDLDEETVREKLSQRTSNDALLRRRVDKALADQVRDACAANGWKGIYLNEDTKRVYPMGNFAGSILGFTNVDNEGMAGLELKYNKALTGRSGQVLTLKNAWGYTTPVQYDTYVPPVPGNTLTLTIDANIQHYLENYLSYAVQEYNVAARGVGIVMDVNTGAVLAMSTKPDYDPNHPRALTDETARNEVEQLEATLHGLNTSTITQNDVNTACDHFKKARQYWELSEAFLMGAASDFDIDPTIDSWPLNRTLLLSYFKNGMSQEALEDATILGFHALEFILFRNGNPRQVSELQGNDTYKNFTSVSGAQELAYAQTICTLLKQRTYQLQVAWEGETAANKSRADVVKAANLSITTPYGLSYGCNLVNAGISGSKSTFPTLQTAIAQVLSDDEGSCVAIANEVGTAKISNPFSAGDISYVESPYSYNSITDFCDNIRSIRNVWLGSTDGTAAAYSMHGFFANVGLQHTNTAVESAYEQAIGSIANMPAPFVKYVSTIWNLAFEDDESWE